MAALMILERSVDKAAPATPKFRIKMKKIFPSMFRMLEPNTMAMGNLVAPALYRAMNG